MKKSRLAVLALALAAAGGAYMLASSPHQAPVENAAAPPPPQTEDVLIASKDLPMGTVVGEGEISWQPWPKSGVAPGMIVKAENPKVMDDIRGSIARGAFFQGEPIHREKLIKGTNSGFMSAILPSGMRAVAINIDSQGANSAGGFILPNDRVDVIRTYADDSTKGVNGSGTLTSETLLRNVRVLAIGQNVQEKNGQPVVVGSNATLELDPVQAETIVLAQRVGQLSLTLRSMLDANKETDSAPKADKAVTVVRFGLANEGGLR